MNAQPERQPRALSQVLILPDTTHIASSEWHVDTIQTTIRDDAGNVIATLQTSLKASRLLARELTRVAVKIGIDRIIADADRLAYDRSYLPNVLGITEADEVATYNQAHGVGALQDIAIVDEVA